MSSTNDAPKDTWSASLYNKAASFVYSDAYTRPVLDLLDLKQGERILDLGCGTGELTVRLQEFVGPNGFVVGMDASEDMLAKAKNNGLKKSFCCDAQNFVWPSEFSEVPGTLDAVFTNAALHWCKRDPPAVVRAAKLALKPGGRFVGEFGGYLNCVGLRSALHEVLRKRGVDSLQVLEAEGFQVKHISLHPRITPLPGHLTDWLRAFARTSLLVSMGDEEAEEIMQEVSDICEPDMKDENGGWAVMYVRLRFVAVSPV